MFCCGAKIDLSVKVFVAGIGTFFNRLRQRTATSFGTFRIFMLKGLRNYWPDSLLHGLRPEFFPLAGFLKYTKFEFCSLDWKPEDRRNPKVPSTVINLWLPTLFHTKIRALFNAMKQKENSCFMRNVGFSSSHQYSDSSLNENFVIHIISLKMEFSIAPTRRGFFFAKDGSTKTLQQKNGFARKTVLFDSCI